MAKKTPESHSALPSDDDDDTDSSSSEGEPSTPPKKPSLDPTPTTKTTATTKPRSKPNHKPSNPTPIPRKRPPPPPPPTTTPHNKGSKKPKTTTTRTAVEDEAKKSTTPMFQRLWSDDDEIVILKGMLEYKEKKGADPMADTNGFHDFIKDSLHSNFDRIQMVSKVRRLKKRFVNSVGKNRTVNQHESAVLDLCEKIWENYVKSPRIDKKTTKTKIEKEEGGWKFIGKASVAMGLNENVVKSGLRLCDEDKKGEIEEKWKELYLEEIKIFSRKLDLAHEENKMIVEALRSGRK